MKIPVATSATNSGPGALDSSGAPVAVSASDPSGLVDHFFRHESGRLVASLTRFFGPQHLSLAEDVSQEALLRALRAWTIGGVPANPSAWITRVAKNLALDALRHETLARNKEDEITAHQVQVNSAPGLPDGNASFAGEMNDDLLRMMFVCCSPELSRPLQVALILKTLCGFGTGEIAHAFLTSEATIRKRLQRARETLRSENIEFEIPECSDLGDRLGGVLAAIYFLFNEGYHASSGERVVREDLCHEAIRLGGTLIEHPAGDTPKVHALMALMLLLAARLPARIGDSGDILLLDQQEREKWDTAMIASGMKHLAHSAQGADVTDYHLQAGIAACHSCAAGDASTDWNKILNLYDQLAARSDSPVVQLNRAVAVAKVHGPGRGLAAIEAIADPSRLDDYHLLHAVTGEFQKQLNDKVSALGSFERALEVCKLEPERKFLRGKIAEMKNR